MSGALPASVAWPLLASLLLALPVRRVGAVAMARFGLAASVLTLLLTGLDTLWPWTAGGQFWLGDRLALSLALLVALPGVLAGLPALGALPTRVAAGGRARAVAVQLATGGAIAACRADPVFLMLIGLGVMLAGAVLLRPDRSGAVPYAALLLTAWLGAACLSVTTGAPARWVGLPGGVAAGIVGRMPAAVTVTAGGGLAQDGVTAAAGIAPVLPGGAAAGFAGQVGGELAGCGLLLLLLPMLLLVWLALANRLEAPTRERALPPLLLAVPALGAALRLRGLSADPSLLQAGRLVLCGGGVLMLLWSCALATVRRDLAGRVVLAASVQLGTVLVGFGVGGTDGVVAGVMILGALTLLLPVALLPVGQAGGVRLQAVAVLALAGLPPFGLFAGDFMLLLRLFASGPVLALLVLAAIAATGLSLLDALRRMPAVAAASGGSMQWLPGVVLLALLGWLGVAMPAPLSDWLLGVSEVAGNAPPAAGVAPTVTGVAPAATEVSPATAGPAR